MCSIPTIWLSWEQASRGNRLGFAVQLCALRHPGRVLDPSESPPAPMLTFVARQIGADPVLFGEYAAGPKLAASTCSNFKGCCASGASASRLAAVFGSA